MNYKNFTIIALIIALPLLAFFILSSRNESLAQKSNSTEKPQIIKFTSLMCLDCKRLNEVMVKVYPKYSEDIILTEVQVQNNDKYTNDQIAKYNVSLVPTMILLDKKGNKIEKIEGFLPEKDLENKMKAMLNE
ncbi:MAG: hypothetical protein DKM22_01325 [Candidatus Melainabacteria bacterium]|nr:MAG: hypothetical protein DKM22_01325 [Candidatus Melainabacteria bacterium]